MVTWPACTVSQLSDLASTPTEVHVTFTGNMNTVSYTPTQLSYKWWVNSFINEASEEYTPNPDNNNDTGTST